MNKDKKEKNQNEYFVMDDGGRPEEELTPEMIKDADEYANQLMKEFYKSSKE